jgi:hypothetical protein
MSPGIWLNVLGRFQGTISMYFLTLLIGFQSNRWWGIMLLLSILEKDLSLDDKTIELSQDTG